jgi:XTP/dITP diphosphohydrolase
MKDIIICTGNTKKIAEFNKILELNPSLNCRFKSIQDLIESFDVDETGESFFENSLLKAQAGAKLTDSFCIADDSGIEINALNGKPGIYSKRYLELKVNGVHDILEELEDATDRGCRYVCSIVLVNPLGELVFSTENYWQGLVGFEARGKNGFGFDPIVHPNEYPTKTVSELDIETKNKLSHRAQAMSALKEFLRQNDI